MIRALAEYIMRGRISAISIALIGSWIPLLTQATLGLVTLRKGWKEGIIVTLWALLPTMAGLWWGDVAKSMVYASIAVIVVSYGTSWFLRLTISWSLTLMAMTIASALSALCVYLIVPDITAEVSAFFERLMSPANTEDNEAGIESIDSLLLWSAQKTIGLIAFWVSVSVLTGLLVARWWQAMLYNPGGFRDEFYRLRLSPSVASFCFVATVFCLLGGEDYRFWGFLFGFPLLISGLGLVHCALGKYKVGVGAVVALYIALIMVAPLGLILSLVGFSDVWLDYRKRFNLV